MKVFSKSTWKMEKQKAKNTDATVVQITVNYITFSRLFKL